MKNKSFFIISILISLRAESINCTEKSVNTNQKKQEIVIFDNLKNETELQLKEQDKRDKIINKELQEEHKKIDKSIEEKYSKKCIEKDAESCQSHGHYLESLNRLAEASIFYKKGCDLKYNWSCDAAGRLEVKKGNLEKGRTLLNKACDSGLNEACSYLIQIKNLK